MMDFSDHGKKPYAPDVEDLTEENTNYRTAIWTGKHLQMTLMSIEVGDDIGLELHKDTDQFLRIEEGDGLVQMGKTKSNLDFEQKVEDGTGIFVPAGYWHNVTNIGDEPLKMYSIYAPPHHPASTVHTTHADGDAAEAAEHVAKKAKKK